MKKGYKRLLYFTIGLIIILLANTFIFNLLSGYKKIIFLLGLLVSFDIYFVIEKNKSVYTKSIMFETLLYTLFFFVFFYLLGLLVGLTKIPNYYTVEGMMRFVVRIALYCGLREVFRYNLLCKAEGNRLCTVLVVVLIFLFDITDVININKLKTSYDIFRFIALIILPSISENISYSYISKKVGYIPIILFDLIIKLYPYLIPLIPNPNEYIMAILYLLLPIVFAYRIIRFFERKKDDKIPRDYHKKKLKGILLPVIIVVALVYFYSGYFKYYALAIASGSMEPKIKVGDVVIVNQKYKDEKLNIGQVIAYKREKSIIVHRIVKKIKIGNKYIYYTKGDANDNIDDFIIEKDIILGTVNSKVPLIGYPTVWINKE